MCERELETERNSNILNPPSSSSHSRASFLFSWAAQPGAWGPSFCWDMVLIPASSLQLIWTSYRRGYIIIWHPPTSCERHICTQFNPSTIKVIPWSPDIYDRMHLLFTQVHFLFWQLSQDGGKYATIWIYGFWNMPVFCDPPNIYIYIYIISETNYFQ